MHLTSRQDIVIVMLLVQGAHCSPPCYLSCFIWSCEFASQKEDNIKNIIDGVILF